MTDHIGLVSTISSTFSNTYTAVRQLLSLEHVTKGRVSWDLVTLMKCREASNYGINALPMRKKWYKKTEKLATLI